MLPPFDIHGVLPPIRPDQGPGSGDRSPYTTDMLTFCERFGDTSERRAILRGLLNLRDALRGLGIVKGFQWLDGSFVEDVERLRSRAPADIDVVTFCAFGDTEQQRLLESIDPAKAKETYMVDHYFVQTDGQTDPERASADLTRWAAYWYSMWAHQRDTQRWKGFASVLLSSNDVQARMWLDQQTPDGGGAP